MLKNNLKTQFLQKLNEEDLSLDDRLNIAYGALLSQDFNVNGKEQIIIEWFAECFKVKFSQSKTLLKMLTKCLESDCLQTYSNTIDASRLLEAVENLDFKMRKKYSKHLLKCFLRLLKNSGFQRYCRFEIQAMCQAVLLMCESWEAAPTVKGILEESSADGDIRLHNKIPEEVCHCIHSIYKVTQQRSELKQQFVKSILPAMLKFDCNLKESERFQGLIEELIIGEDLQLFCEAFKLETKKKVPLHLKALVDLLTKNEMNCDLIAVSSLCFDKYVNLSLKNCPEDLNHLTLFFILSSVFRFHLPLPYNTVTAIYLSTSEQFSVLAELVAVFHKHNISSSSESHEGALSHYLILILKQLLSGEYVLSSELLHTVVNIFKLYPESVRPVFSLIMLNVVLVRKENKVLKSFDYLMMNIVKIFSDLNRLDKFFELFFQSAVIVSKKQDLSGLTCELLLTKGFYSVLSEKLTSLTGNQMKLIIGQLEKIFSKEFISPVESTCLQNGSFCLLLKLMVNVLCYILENAPIFLASRWNIVSGDVQNICLSVKKFGVAVLQGDKKNEFLLEFLHFVKVLADVELVVNEYIMSMSNKRILPIIKSKDKSVVVHNLSKSHGFLTSQDWIYISEVVKEASDKSLTNLWHDLLFQKLMRMADEDILAHLVVEGDSEWLWTTVATMGPTVPLSYLELYTNKLLSSLSSPQQLIALENINILSSRAFRITMTFQTLNHLARSQNSSLSGILAKLFDIHPVIKFEMEFSSEESEKVGNITKAVASAINTHFWNDQAPLMLNPEKKIFYSRLFDVLSLMHSHCLKTDTKGIVFLMMIGLSCDLRCETDLLPTILDLILGCLDDIRPVVPNSIDYPVLLHWLATVVPSDYPHRPQLCVVALTKVLPLLTTDPEKISREFSDNTDLLCASLQALITAYSSKRIKSTEDYKKLIKTLLLLTSSLVAVKKPKPKEVQLFTVALKVEYIFFKEISSSLLSLLPKYLEILLESLKGSYVMEPDTVELVEIVMQHRTELPPEVMSRVCTTITQELCRTDLCPILCYPSTVQAFFQALPSEDYEKVLREIYSHQQKNVSNMCELWSVVVSTQEGKDKARVRNRMLVEVLTQCQKLLLEDVSRFHSSVLSLLHSILIHKFVSLSPKLLDLVLVLLGEIPTDSHPQFLHDSLSSLSALIHVQAELVFDRIPVFLQRLRKFIKSLVLMSPPEDVKKLSYNTLSNSSINQVTRIIKTMTDHHSIHFVRISPYLIADILHLLVTHPVETSVKVELQNCVCHLLNICDHHGMQQLQNLLPIASVELFKVITMTYRKDYKYTGKV